MDDFVSEYCDRFIDVTDEQLRGEDNNLEYWSIYQEFLKEFESKLSGELYHISVFMPLTSAQNASKLRAPTQKNFWRFVKRWNSKY